MKFSSKIFLALFSIATIVSSLCSLGFYEKFSTSIEGDYIRQYKSASQAIANTLQEMEKLTDLIMLNAGLAVRDNESKPSALTKHSLIQLRNSLHVSNIYIIDKTGKYIQSTDDYAESNPKSFFEFCEDYKNLITGRSNLERTPIILSYPPNNKTPYKFTQIPNHNRTKIIEIGIHLSFIAKILTDAINNYSDINSIGLFTPAGQSLGLITSRAKENQINGDLPNDLEDESVQILKDKFIIYKKVKADSGSCCQCKNKGLTKGDDKYYYLLRIDVSKESLERTINSINTTSIVLILLSLVSSLILSHVVSKKLLRRIELIQTGMVRIVSSRNLMHRLNIPGSDEIANLGRQFDVMVASLEAAQKDLISMRKSQGFKHIQRASSS